MMRTELLIDGEWTDITADVRTENEIGITRGKSDYASQAAPSALSLTLDNRDGKYSPRNPLSPYYGLIGRNTQIRLGIVDLAAPAFDAASNAAASTGNFSWTHTPVGTPRGVLVVIVQTGSTSDQMGSVTYGGVAMERLPVGGLTSPGGFIYKFFLGTGIPTGAQTVSVTVAGAATKRPVALTVTGNFDTEIDGNVSQQGSTSNPTCTGLVTTVQTAIFGVLHSGQDAITSVAPGTGYTDVLEHDFGLDVMSVTRKTAAAAAGSQLVPWVATADTWGAHGVALKSVAYRFHGEVSSFPPRWNIPGSDGWASIEAAGILRRLGQGRPAATAGLREVILEGNPARYWQLSGGAGATYSLNIAPNNRYSQFFPPIKSAGNPTVAWSFGEGDLGAYLPASFLLSNSGVSTFAGSNAVSIGSYTYTALDFVARGQSLAPLRAGFYDYNGQQWVMEFSTFSGDITAVFYASDGAVSSLGSTAALGEFTDNAVHHFRLDITQDGADVDWRIYVDGTVRASGTNTGTLMYGMSQVFFRYQPLTDLSVALGHVTAWSGSAPSAADLTQAMNGYAGETAAERMERICALSGTPLTIVGDQADTSLMGPQYAENLLAQLRDAETTDLGALGEARDSFSLLYRTRASVYNQTPKATLDYTAGELAPPFEPTDDDQNTRNDITATRRDGGSYQATLETGPLSVLEPPDGVGRYDDSVTVNVETDSQLTGVATWLLHLGTIDEARYPSISVNLAAPDVAGNAALIEALLAADTGDVLVITNASSVNIYDDVSALVLGYRETITPTEHIVTFNCAPASPYSVATYATSASVGSSRYDNTDSYVSFGVDDNDTLFFVTNEFVGWTTDSAAFPFDIYVGGERMTVSNVATTWVVGTPQTFTVTRSVNGVVKSHGALTPVRLWDTPIYSL